MENKIQCLWTDEYKLFEWHETFVLDEVPLHDLWDNFSTTLRLELDKFHREQGVVKECTRHYMSFIPELPQTMNSVLEHFSNKTYSYNFLKLTGSYCIPMHYDSYSTFVRRNNISEKEFSHISRTIVMITPWKHGQVIQIGDQIISHWAPGDLFTWKGQEWHGASNFGFNDLVVMQVTWI